MKHLSETLFWLGVMAMTLLCAGEPDILDGFIVRANQCNAVSANEGRK